MAVDTLPKLLKLNYAKYGNKKIALREKSHGIWKSYTWEDFYKRVKYLSLGLMSLGLERGDKVAILGETMAEAYCAELAVQAAAAVMVGIYIDCAPQEVKYYMEHSDAKFVVAHDQEQVDKFLIPYKDREGNEHLSLKDELPLLKKVIYWDPKGLWFYEAPILMSFDEMLELGREYEKMHPGLFEQSIEEGKGSDICMFMYTSGTTGQPKGAMLSHNAIIWLDQCFVDIDNWHDNEDYLAALSLAHIGEQAYGPVGTLLAGRVANFPEDPETVQSDIRELGADIVFYGARQWEGINRSIQAHMIDASTFKRFMYSLFLPVGYKLADMCQAGREFPLFWKMLGLLAHAAVFRALLDKIGLLSSRVNYTSGAGISPEVPRFFSAIGIPIRNVYGSTEISMVTIHRPDDVKFETVGAPMPGVELRISDEGEIQAKTPGEFTGYYKDPDGTRKKWTKQGWYCTGDFGYIDQDGHLIAMDRMEGVMPLAGGRSFSSQYVEVRLRFSPYIKDAISLGGEDREFVGVLIDTDIDNVGRWAEARRIAYTTYADLSQKIEVIGLIKREIQKINKSLPEAAKIKRFANLHKSLDPDEAELTRTRKLRRGFIDSRYGDLINGIYKGADEVEVEIPVTYRDGRSGVAKGRVKFTDVD